MNLNRQIKNFEIKSNQVDMMKYNTIRSYDFKNIEIKSKKKREIKITSDSFSSNKMQNNTFRDNNSFDKKIDKKENN